MRHKHLDTSENASAQLINPLVSNFSNMFLLQKYYESTMTLVLLLLLFYVCQFEHTSDSPQNCNFVQSLKQGLAHNPTLHCRYLNFVLVSLFFMEHTTPNTSSFQGLMYTMPYISLSLYFSSTFQGPMFTVPYIKLDQLTGGRGFSSPWDCLWVRHPSPFLYLGP